MTKVSGAKPDTDGKVDETGSPPHIRPLRATMTAHSASAARTRTRTGGPKGDGPKIVEHIVGWTLVVVIAMLVTQIGLL